MDEWLGTYLDPLMKQLCETRDRGNRVLGMVLTNKESFVKKNFNQKIEFLGETDFSFNCLYK